MYLFLLDSINSIINLEKVYHGKYGFRINFIIGIILNALSTITLYLFYHPPSTGKRLEGQTKWQALKALDWTGLVLLNVGVILFLVPLSLGGSTFPWGHPGVIAPLVISVVFFITFAIWEAKLAKNPFFEHSLFKGQPCFFRLLSCTYKLKKRNRTKPEIQSFPCHVILPGRGISCCRVLGAGCSRYLEWQPD